MRFLAVAGEQFRQHERTSVQVGVERREKNPRPFSHIVSQREQCLRSLFVYECDWVRECVPPPRPIKTDISAARSEKSMTKKRGTRRQQMRALLYGQSAKIIAPLVLQPSRIKRKTLSTVSIVVLWSCRIYLLALSTALFYSAPPWLITS